MRRHRSALWYHSNFLKLWTGATLSELGSQVTLLALPLTAVLTLHATPGQMGLLGSVASAPYLLVSPFAGVWVDRLRRQPLLIITDVGRAVPFVSIPAAAVLGRLTLAQLLLVGFLAGSCTVVADLAGQAFLPSLVDRTHLLEANSLQDERAQGQGIVGPALAGILVQLLTAVLAIAVDALSYVLSTVCLSRIRTSEPELGTDRHGHTLWGEITEGFQAVLGHRLLRPIALSGGRLNLFGSMLEAVWWLFALHTLRLQPAALGILEAMCSGGFLVGAWLTPWSTRRFGAGVTMVAGALLMALTWLPLPLLGGSPAVVFVVLLLEHALSGLGNPLCTINAASLRLTVPPDRLLGRMSATYRLIGRGALPVGALLGGILGAQIGIRATLAVAALGLLLGPFWLLISPVLTLSALPDAATELSHHES